MDGTHFLDAESPQSRQNEVRSHDGISRDSGEHSSPTHEPHALPARRLIHSEPWASRTNETQPPAELPSGAASTISCTAHKGASPWSSELCSSLDIPKFVTRHNVARVNQLFFCLSFPSEQTTKLPALAVIRKRWVGGRRERDSGRRSLFLASATAPESQGSRFLRARIGQQEPLSISAHAACARQAPEEVAQSSNPDGIIVDDATATSLRLGVDIADELRRFLTIVKSAYLRRKIQL
ncbi:hypothetical protein BC835DRAFT_195842 [Cytidiella melzeri]|nr:hypothetical protein BC835DRAFT_195842 [Cytidiella melzeri]